MPMSLNYVQERIGYSFFNHHFLSSALTAAEKDNVEENVDTIEHWSKSKHGRASACTSLGLDRCIIQSVRQGHVNPSRTVLAYTLSAIIGAVWLDMEVRKSGLDMAKRISEILARIDMLIAEKRSEEPSTACERILSVCDTEDIQESISREDQDFTAWNQHTSHLEVPLLRGSIQNHSEAFERNDSVAYGVDFESILPSIYLDPFDHFQGTMHESNIDVADALISPIQSMEMMRLSSAAVENTNNNNPLLELEGAIKQTYQRYQVFDHTVADTRQASSDITETSETALACGSMVPLREHRRTVRNTSLHQRLVREEMAKLPSVPTRLHENLMKLLDHDGIDELSAHVSQASQLRLIYLTIGSCQSLRDFKEALRYARGSRNNIYHPQRHAMTCAQRFQEICRLDDTECFCILLRRFHVVKLFAEELEVLYPNDMIVVNTPASFVGKQTAEMGNPAIRRKAALIDAVLRKIKPELQEGTAEYKRCRAQVKQLRRLAGLLEILTGTYGSGILALLPCSPTYSELSSLESTLSSINDESFRLFSDMVHASQGPVLKELSKAIEPALIALVNGEISSNLFPIEYMEPEVFDELPKGSMEIIQQLSEPTSSRHQ